MTAGEIETTNLLLVVDPARAYPTKLQELLAARYPRQSINVTNSGRGGETAVLASHRLNGVLDATKFEAVLLLAGVNDLNAEGRRGMQPALDALETMMQSSKRHGAQPFVATLPPQRQGGFRAGSYELVDPFNAALKQVVLDENATLVDVNAAFHGDVSLLGPDGLHPTAAGYERIAQAFFESVKARFETQTRF